MEFNEGDELETSKVEEELGLVLQASDFDIQLFLHIRIDGKIAIRRALGNTTRRSFNIADFEEEVLQILTRHINGTNFEITKITAAIKHESSRGGSLYLDIEFSIIAADEMMTLIEQKRSNFRKGNMVITFEMLAKRLPKQASDRAPSVLPGGFIRSSPPPPTSDDATSQPPANRSTVRASRLQEEHVARVEAIRTAGTFQRQLMDRWRCTEDNCTNKDNFCWPDPSNRLLHYNITTPQHETWSNAIASGTATLLNPPASLLTYWIREQGPISRDSRQPIKQSAAQENRLNMTGMLEMQQKMQIFMMQTRMMDQMELMEEKQERREERIERRQHIRDQRDRDREMLALLAYKAPTKASTQPSATPQSIPINFSTPLASMSAPPPTPTPPDRTSSPIDININDGDLIHQFFEWKIINTRLAERRVKWEHAREVVAENEWSIKDLYEMEDYKSVMYDRAIQAKIPDGLTRHFREELRAFKPVYRRLRATDFMAA
ncbi:hypothetical protein BJX66DRAFT_344650 [Aspergillus keveii]|uniref:Uncharacterized protein n=1 Tax=Aspergillus keveii TaxID=714993 RepID=A0ABR4FKK3_9EURO